VSRASSSSSSSSIVVVVTIVVVVGVVVVVVVVIVVVVVVIVVVIVVVVVVVVIIVAFRGGKGEGEGEGEGGGVVMGEKVTRGSLSVAVIDSTFSATIIYKNAFNSLYNVWLPSQTAMRQGLVVNPNSWQVSKSVSV
jgi:hypothetical protein